MKAIFFDLGDTLIDFSPTNQKAIFESAARKTHAYLSAKNIPLPPLKKYFSIHYGIVLRSYLWSHITRREFNSQRLMEAVVKKLRLPCDEAERRELSFMWYQPAMEKGSVDPALLTMLSNIRAAGIKMAIVSNTFVPPHCLDRHMQAEGLLEFFPERIYSCEVGYRKPHPKIFHAALQRLGVDARDSLFVGDVHAFDIVGARGVGMKTVWKPTAKDRARKRIGPPADYTIERITDLFALLPQIGFHQITAVPTPPAPNRAAEAVAAASTI